jgi:tetratricopeptide (TPR) repeat protein
MSSQDQLKAKGNEAFKAKKYPEAIEWYTKAIDVDPNCEAAAALYSNRAASYAGMGNHEAAVKDGDQCIRVKPAWLKGHYRKGAALEALNRFDECLKAFEDALRTEPANEEVQEKVKTIRDRIRERNDKTKPSMVRTSADAKVIGNSLFSSGKYEQAMEFYSRAIELAGATGATPEDKANFHTNRAACRQQTHDYAGVIEDANAALELVPNHVKALLRRAIAREGLEKWQASLDDYQAVNRLSPGMSNVAQGIMRCQRSLR